MRGHADGTLWIPSETDVSIRPGWYYHASEDHKLKSLSQLTDIYYESVGRNSLLLLNLTPNQEGLIPEQDSLRLVEWYRRYTSELKKNLVNQKMKVTGKNRKKLKYTLDGNRGTYWEADTKNACTGSGFWKRINFQPFVIARVY